MVFWLGGGLGIGGRRGSWGRSVSEMMTVAWRGVACRFVRSRHILAEDLNRFVDYCVFIGIMVGLGVLRSSIVGVKTEVMGAPHAEEVTYVRYSQCNCPVSPHVFRYFWYGAAAVINTWHQISQGSDILILSIVYY